MSAVDQASPTFTSRETAMGRAAGMAAVTAWSAGNVMVTQIDLPGPSIAFWRMILATLLYSSILVVARKRITTANLKRTAAAGITMALQISLFFAAVKSTTIATATVIGAMQPLLLLGWAARRYNEKVTGWLVAIALVALTGTGLVVFGASNNGEWTLRGDLLAAVATVMFALFFVLAKEARQDVGALEFQTCVWVWGSITLLPVVLINSGGLDIPNGQTWGWLVLLLFIPGTGHFLMNWSHPRVRLSFAGMLTLAVPVLSTLGAFLFLDQDLRSNQVLGMVIVLGVLVLVVRRDVALQSQGED